MALFSFQQSARTNLPGPSFLALLHHFRKEPLAVLYSGDLQGHSVIARKPLITLSAADEHSPLRLQSARHLPLEPPDQQPSILDTWESAITRLNFHEPHHPLTAWIGHFSYDLARTLEPLPSLAKNDHPFPLLHWQLFEEYFLFDHATNCWTTTVTTCPGFTNEQPRRDAMEELLRSTPTPTASIVPQPTLLESMPRELFLRSVERIKNYIAAGDIFQANFAQRWKFNIPAHPIDLFENLMQTSPSAYAALLIDFTDDGTRRAAISASPELLLHRRGRHLLTRPIKGTRPRDLANPAHDEQLRLELLHSTKDQAELAMIVDLLRNDLGRVAEYGSVRVTTERAIEPLPTLWHAHSDIEANYFTPNIMGGNWSPANDPRPNTWAKPWSPLLRALLPGGSITGAPKIRATQIIEQLEPHRRGLYCGAIGAIAPKYATLNLAIRTMQMLNQTLTLHAGAGIVADSNPEAEYQETLDKARAMFGAIGASIQSGEL